MNKIAIFKIGRQTATSGQSQDFTAQMMVQVVTGYDVSKHEAPAVIGHPKDNHPAYGWVKSLSFDEGEGVLYAEFSQVEAQFEQLLKDGRFKKRSASFYPPNHPQNPTPGKWYLRHVGFLGAQPPAVKGLKDFADDADCPTFEFSDSSINKTDEETMSDKDKKPTEHPEGDEKTTAAELAAREARIAAEEAKLKAREDAIAKREKELAEEEAKAQEKDFAEFSDTLIAQGKLAPAEKDAIVSVFIDVDNAGKAFDFAEGGEVKHKSSIEVLKDILQRGAPIIDFSERTGTDPNNASKPKYGESESEADAKLHKVISDFAEKQGISFAEAVVQFNEEV